MASVGLRMHVSSIYKHQLSLYSFNLKLYSAVVLRGGSMKEARLQHVKCAAIAEMFFFQYSDATQTGVCFRGIATMFNERQVMTKRMPTG
jgi:hypothetical protein